MKQITSIESDENFLKDFLKDFYLKIIDIDDYLATFESAIISCEDCEVYDRSRIFSVLIIYIRFDITLIYFEENL